MISARGLRKSFGDFEAVKGIDVEVRRGEAFGFLGPNGAGKSSTMRMIAAVSPVSGGELRILGMDPAVDGPAIRGRLGVCPQEDTLDNELNVRDNLYIYGRYFGIPKAEVSERADELLEFVQLTDKAKSKVDDLCGGMKRRLTIARSLINSPDLLLLDEPTTGLDPQARHVLWDRLFRLKQPGVTLVITTHYMDEAEQLCDRLVVMDKGVIVAEGSPLDLIREHSTREVAELRFGVAEEGENHDALAEKVADLGDGSRCCPTGCWSTATTATRSSPRCTSAGSSPPRRWCGAARSRTSSSASPAGRWSTDGGHPREPRPPARRGRRRSAARSTTGRSVYQRTWRATVVSSFLAPLLYVVAMGVLLGGFIEGDPDVLEGATSYFDFVVPGPDRRARDADRGRRDDVPGHGHDQVAADLRLDAGHAARLPRPGRPRTCRSCCSGWRRRARVYMLVLAPFGVYGSWWGPFAAFLSQLLVGMAFAVWVYGFSARLTSEEGFGVLFRLGVFPLFLFSGAFFPISNLGDVGECVARCTPLWHGVNLSRMFAWTTSPGGWPPSTSPCWSCSPSAGWFWAVSGLEKRLVRDRASRCSPLGRCAAPPGCWCCATTSSTARTWKLFLTGFLEPVFYLLSIGIGVGQLIDTFEFNGQQVPYAEFVAPGMLAASAFNGALHRRDLQRLSSSSRTSSSTTRCWRRRSPPATSPAARSRGASCAGRQLLRGVPGDHGRDGAGALVVGDAGASRRRC